MRVQKYNINKDGCDYTYVAKTQNHQQFDQIVDA